MVDLHAQDIEHLVNGFPELHLGCNVVSHLQAIVMEDVVVQMMKDKMVACCVIVSISKLKIGSIVNEMRIQLKG